MLRRLETRPFGGKGGHANFLPVKKPISMLTTTWEKVKLFLFGYSWSDLHFGVGRVDKS
jgi:hypothetical protein